jgi:hypothetical protein
MTSQKLTLASLLRNELGHGKKLNLKRNLQFCMADVVETSHLP